MSNVKNVRVEPIKLKIGDENLSIKYDFNAFIELEEIYGSIEEAMEAVQGKIILDEKGKPEYVEDEKEEGGFKLDDDGNKVEKRKISLKAMRNFLWAGLLFGDEKINKKKVAHLLEFGNFQYVVGKMMEAITGALPEKVDDEKN